MQRRKQHRADHHRRPPSQQRLKPQVKIRLQQKLLAQRPDHIGPQILKLRPLRIRRNWMSTQDHQHGNRHRHATPNRKNRGGASSRRPHKPQFPPTAPTETEPRRTGHHRDDDQCVQQASRRPEDNLQQPKYEDNLAPNHEFPPACRSEFSHGIRAFPDWRCGLV